MDTYITPTPVLLNHHTPERSIPPHRSLEEVALIEQKQDVISLAFQGVAASSRATIWDSFRLPVVQQFFDDAMTYETTFDYTGNSLGSDPFTINSIMTPDFSFPDTDLGNMLSFTPGVRPSQTPIANMPANYNNSSEFPFPQLSASVPAFVPFSSETASTMISAELPMTPYDDFHADRLPWPVLMSNQLEPPSIFLQEHVEVQRKENEARTTPSSPGQKRTQIATNSPGHGTENQPKPKRRRSARKKVRTAEEERIRRERHLQRNRDAAQKCRQKKKLSEADMKEQIFEERNKNHITWNNVGVAQLATEQFRIFAQEIQSSCLDNERKTVATLGLERVIRTAQKLQDQIDMFNEKRGNIAEGLIMHKSSGAYVKQDSMQDAQSPGTSPQSSNCLPDTMCMTRSNSYEQMTIDNSTVQTYTPGGRRSYGIASGPASRASLSAHQIDTDFANGIAMSRGGSNSSTVPPGSTGSTGDSAVGLDSPPYAKKKSHEDEAIDDSSYSPKMSPARQIPPVGDLAHHKI